MQMVPAVTINQTSNSRIAPRRWLALSAVALLLSITSGCGGSGGGGGGGGTSSSNTGTSAATGIAYTGATTAATLSGTNASKLTNNIVGTGAQAVVSGLAGISVTAQSGPPSGGGISAIARTLGGVLRAANVPTMSGSGALAGTAQAVDTTTPCDSGNIHLSGTIDDATGTGSVAFTFNDCRSGTDTVTGTASGQVNSYDAAFRAITDMVLTFSQMSLRGTGVSLDFSGTFHDEIHLTASTETVTTNFVIRDNIAAHVTKADNLVFVNASSNILSPVWFTQTINGRIYDQTEGYVDVNTAVPFMFSTVSQATPDTGQMVLRGAANAGIRLTTLSSRLLSLELDLNGDGVYENTAMLHWTDLVGPIGSDLRDNDGDGMHNSWEAAYGLNPNDSSDAALDKDGDGATNKVEYLAGTDPTDPMSIPPIVALGLTMDHSPDPVSTGASLTYTINVKNYGSNAALNVVVIDSLPTSVNFISMTTPQGATCSGASVVTCRFGTLSANTTTSITLTVTPTVPGLVTNTAKMTSESYEPNLVDNTVSAATAVGTLGASIQAQIDAASPGQTISIAPGIYIGGLDFHGKNITLQSTGGPQATIITGGNPVVSMGPGGTLKGFTITASSGPTYASGVSVTGAGTLISGNIFDGMAISAAISGDNASPTVERNVFRNQNCRTSPTTATIVFGSASAPLIVNNVFENNPCRGISIDVFQGFAVEVVNNTFVGNVVGIHIIEALPETTQIYRNNILAGNGVGLEIEGGGPNGAYDPIWTNNLVFGNTTDYANTVTKTAIDGNISASPLFIDQAGGDYHLKAGSPAIDAGTAQQAPSVDFDGLPRPNGSGVDVGAFEFQ